MSASAHKGLFPQLDLPEALSEYAGICYSEELNADYKLTLEGNNLIHLQCLNAEVLVRIGKWRVYIEDGLPRTPS